MNNTFRPLLNGRRLAAVALAVAVVPFAAGPASAASKGRSHHVKRATSAAVTAAPVVATTAAAFDGGPVILVAHDEDGEWQFLGPGGDDLTPVHLAHLVESHPALAQVGDLPVGWEATADPAGSWSRAPAEDD